MYVVELVQELLRRLRMVVLAAIVQSVLPGQGGGVNGCGINSVLVEAEDLTLFLSLVRVAAGHVSQAGGFRRAAALAP